jgi:hypothetical protein
MKIDEGETRQVLCRGYDSGERSGLEENIQQIGRLQKYTGRNNQLGGCEIGLDISNLFS